MSQVNIVNGIFRPKDNTLGLVTNYKERIRIDDNGNIGIGTIAPSKLFDINGQVRVRDLPSTNPVSLVTALADGCLEQISFPNDASVVLLGDGTWGAGGGSGGSDNDWEIIGQNLVSAYTGSPIGVPTGNVGVGTASPQGKLHVSTPGGPVHLQLERTSSGNQNNTISFGISSQPFAGGAATSIAPASFVITMDDPNNSGDMAFSTSPGSIGFIIKHNNNVGIGNFIGTGNDPTTKLDVDGEVRVRTLSTTTPWGLVTHVLDGTLESLRFPQDNTVALLGDGTFGSLSAGGGDSDWEVTASSGNVFTGTTGTTLPNLPQGRVGIGLDTPIGKAHVLLDEIAFGDSHGMVIENRSSLNGSTGARFGLEVRSAGNWGGTAGEPNSVGLHVSAQGGSRSHQNLAAVFDGNVVLGTISPTGQEIGTGGTRVLSFQEGSGPATSPSAFGGTQLWCQNFQGVSELFVMNSAQQVNVLSPHHFSNITPIDPMAWSYYSEDHTLKQKINVDMMRVIRIVEKVSGEKLIQLLAMDDESKSTDTGTMENISSGEIFELRKRINELEKRIDELKG